MKKKKSLILFFGNFFGHLLMGAIMFMALFLVGGTLNAFSQWWVVFSTYRAIKEL